MAKVLVVIVTYNALKWVQKCLRSVEKSTHPADVVVIDNGSTDGTLPLVRTDFPHTRIIETGESQRSTYYNYYTGKKWGHADTYDLCVNTSRLGIEGSIEFIAEFIRKTKGAR